MSTPKIGDKYVVYDYASKGPVLGAVTDVRERLNDFSVQFETYVALNETERKDGTGGIARTFHLDSNKNVCYDKVIAYPVHIDEDPSKVEVKTGDKFQVWENGWMNTMAVGIVAEVHENSFIVNFGIGVTYGDFACGSGRAVVNKATFRSPRTDKAQFYRIPEEKPKRNPHNIKKGGNVLIYDLARGHYTVAEVEGIDYRKATFLCDTEDQVTLSSGEKPQRFIEVDLENLAIVQNRDYYALPVNIPKIGDVYDINWSTEDRTVGTGTVRSVNRATAEFFLKLDDSAADCIGDGSTIAVCLESFKYVYDDAYEALSTSKLTLPTGLEYEEDIVNPHNLKVGDNLLVEILHAGTFVIATVERVSAKTSEVELPFPTVISEKYDKGNLWTINNADLSLAGDTDVKFRTVELPNIGTTYVLNRGNRIIGSGTVISTFRDDATFALQLHKTAIEFMEDEYEGETFIDICAGSNAWVLDFEVTAKKGIPILTEEEAKGYKDYFTFAKPTIGTKVFDFKLRAIEDPLKPIDFASNTMKNATSSVDLADSTIEYDNDPILFETIQKEMLDIWNQTADTDTSSDVLDAMTYALNDEKFNKEFLGNFKENNMNARKITIELWDNDESILEPADRLIGAVKEIITDADNATALNEVMIDPEYGIKAMLDEHNKKRAKRDNQRILNTTGQKVKLQPIRLKDVTFTFKD